MIIKNAIQTPDGTILRSYGVHDYVSHTDKNGETYFTDGGIEYIRRSYNKVPAVSMDIYSDNAFETVREIDFWITYGKDGKQPSKRVSLSEMNKGHIKAILNTQYQIPFELATLFEKELEWRNSETL